MIQLQSTPSAVVTRNSPAAPRITPCGSAGGAVVEGISLSDGLSPGTVVRLRAALDEHGLLIFPAGAVPRGELIAFADMFGEDARVALATPDWAGEARFTNAVLAYAQIERPFAAFLRNLRAADFTDAPCDAVPPLHRPVIRIHPVSGKKRINVNQAETGYILGLSRLSSENLLEILFKALAAPAVALDHRWSAGEVVLWDDFTFQRRESGDLGERRRGLYRSRADPPRARGAGNASAVHARRRISRPT
jgi:alpha-ketoglutarate-dependent taurine dioxygenase